MNMRKAIPLLVIASMMLSMLPSAFFANAVLAAPAVTAITAGATGLKGEIYEVSGGPGQVAAGASVQLYWDDTTVAWDGVKGLLNSTTAKADGSYKVRFKVPEAKNGNHYLWVKVPSTNELQTPAAAFVVNEKMSLSPASGLVGDRSTVSAYGFGASKDIRLVYLAGAPAYPAGWPQAIVAPAAGPTGNAATVTFSGTIANTPIRPGTFTVAATVAPIETFTDNGVGGLVGSVTGTGTINYVTGAWSVTFAAAPGVGAINIGYTWFTGAGLNLLNSGSTNSLGSYTASATIPTGAITGQIAGIDSVGNEVAAGFTVGPVITLNPAIAVVGQVISVTGRGFTIGATIGIRAAPLVNVELFQGATKLNDVVIKDMPVGGIIVDGAGRFTMNIIIPSGIDVNDNYSIKVTSSTPQSAQADLELTKLTNVSVTPSFGPQGSSMSVTGSGFDKVAGKTVTLALYTAATPPVFVINVGTVDTLSDGTFTKNFNVPATADGTYKLRASTASNIMNVTSFRVGTMYVQLSATSGPAGKVVTITGNGFTTTGDWNATIGGEDLVTTAASVAAVGGLINQAASIPSMAPGVYTVTIWDIAADIKITTTFTVTYNTQITVTPSTAPNTYNVSVAGKGFSQAGGATAINFVLYNKTSTGAYDRSWAMTVYTNYDANLVVREPAVVNASGIVRANWDVPAAATLSQGTYYINATDVSAMAYFAQATFVVGAKHVSATPRKASFAAGETISFTMEHTFGLPASVLKIYDPSGNLVFNGDALATWVSSGDWKVAPYSSQTAGGNPMTLRDDAPTGTWSWKWMDGTTTVASGTFTVTAAATSTTDAQIQALAAQITAVSSSVTSLAATVGNVATATTAASNAATAASTAATAAATAAQAATTAANAAGTKADAATAAANGAKAAADSAAAAANGLTTLVYAAIGASLVAALAAIVALMQISRKIA